MIKKCSEIENFIATGVLGPRSPSERVLVFCNAIVMCLVDGEHAIQTV